MVNNDDRIMIEFLERDLKVQQQKLLIQNKSENQKTEGNKQRKRACWKISHFTGNSSMEAKCCFCEEAEEHIATNGPKEMKIVQYFAC